MVIWRSLRGSRVTDHVAAAVRSPAIPVLAVPADKDLCFYSGEKAEDEQGEDDVSKEAEWDWVVEAGSLSSFGDAGAAGGYISGDTPDGFLICDAPHSINSEELQKQLAPKEVPSDTGSAPTMISGSTTMECGSSGGQERGSGARSHQEEESLCQSGPGSFSSEGTPPTTVRSEAETPPPTSPTTTSSAGAKSVAGAWQKEAPKEKRGDGYYCRCNAPSPILMQSEIVSDSYRAMTGPGYFCSAARNITLAEKEQEVIFTSGPYTVRNANCMVCGVTLGIKYVGAHDPANQHKVGKFLLGQDLLMSSKKQ
jgi:hypothetical protein